jgi:hypothetical protein
MKPASRKKQGALSAKGRGGFARFTANAHRALMVFCASRPSPDLPCRAVDVKQYQRLFVRQRSADTAEGKKSQAVNCAGLRGGIRHGHHAHHCKPHPQRRVAEVQGHQLDLVARRWRADGICLSFSAPAREYAAVPRQDQPGDDEWRAEALLSPRSWACRP